MGVPEIDYAAAWREMLEAWAPPAEIASQATESDDAGDGDGWQHLAPQFQRLVEQALETPPGPLISRVLDRVTPGTTVLDVGAGTGRQTLQLASHVGRLTAVEPSPAMRGFLASEVEKRHLDNVDIVSARWQDAQVPAADLVVCSNVFYDVQELVPFVRKLDEHADDACFVEITFRHPLAWMNEMWRHIHGIERPVRPDYFDALAVLHQVGIYANVEIERVPASAWFSSLDEAVEMYRRRLHLPAGSAKIAELRAYLQQNSRESAGRIYPQPETRRVVILWWEADRSAREK